jgi:hypothetical protein
MAERFVDAALSNRDGSHEAAFFLGDQFVIYNYDRDRADNGVHPISELGSPASFTPVGVGASLDAALKGRKQFTNTGYYFRGTDYARFAFPVPAADPNLGALSAWAPPSPLHTGVDAACNGHAPTRDGKAYFFKGNLYARYDWPGDHPDPGFPKPISNMVGMAAMAAPFTSGIDAVDGEGPFAFFSYLFRENRYVRFNWNPSGGGEPLADRPHASTQDHWPGLTELLLAGKAKTQVLAWVEAAQSRLIAFLPFLATGTPFPFDLGVFNAALATHFHVPPGASSSAKAAAVSQVLASFSGVAATLKQSATKFRFRTADEAISQDGNTTVPAAYSFFAGTINFTTGFVRRGPMNRAASLLHESVHVIDDQSGSSATHIPEWYVTDAAADALGLPRQANNPAFATRYDLMTTSNALHNASSYAAFAQHVANGADTRFGEGHPNQ